MKTVTAKKANGKAPKPEPAFNTYTIKTLDRGTWARFAARAKTDGRSIRWLVERFVKDYAEGKESIDLR